MVCQAEKLVKANFWTKKCAMGGIRDIERKRKTKKLPPMLSEAACLFLGNYTVSHASA